MCLSCGASPAASDASSAGALIEPGSAGTIAPGGWFRTRSTLLGKPAVAPGDYHRMCHRYDLPADEDLVRYVEGICPGATE